MNKDKYINDAATAYDDDDVDDMYRVCQKNDPTCFCQNFVKSAPNLINFLHTDIQENKIMWGTLIVRLT